MNNQMSSFSPEINKTVFQYAAVSLTNAQAEVHLDEFCLEWVYSHKTRRNVVETLMESGYHPDFVKLSDNVVNYRLTAPDGRYFPVTEPMFEYAVSRLSRDVKGFHLYKSAARNEKQVDNNHEMAYC